jgi:hypothetical protein
MTDRNPFEGRMLASLDRKPATFRPTPRHRNATDDPLHLVPRRKEPTMPTINAKGALKATLFLEAATLANLRVPGDQPRVVLTIRTPDGVSYTADVSAKSLRKAQAAIQKETA